MPLLAVNVPTGSKSNVVVLAVVVTMVVGVVVAVLLLLWKELH